MELTNKNIEEYIHRFLEGETSNEEEKAIYRFFHTEEVPEHLKPYATMFAWYEEGMPENVVSEGKEQKENKSLFWKRIPLAVWNVGIAAMLVIGVGLGVLSYLDEEKNEEWSYYEGSYTVVNGKRISDVKKIMPLILETLAEADRMEKRIEERLESIRSSEESVLEKEKMMANF